MDLLSILYHLGHPILIGYVEYIATYTSSPVFLGQVEYTVAYIRGLILIWICWVYIE